MLETNIQQELNDAFTEQKLEEYTKQQTDVMLKLLEEKWILFSREMLTEVEFMNITIETDKIYEILSAAYHNIVPLLCMLHSINETDCKRIRKMPSFNSITKDVNYLLQIISTMKTVKLNQTVTNIFGALMNRIDNLKKEHLSWLLAYEDRISDNSKTFLANLVEMIKSEMYHLKFYAPMEVEREKYLYHLYCDTLKNKEKIDSTIQCLVQLDNQVEALKAKKKEYIETNRQFIQDIFDRHFDLRLRYRLEPEGKMVKMGQEFKGRKQMLLAQVNEKSIEYHSFLDKNVKSFQKISDLKFKKETNCQNWIQKYDTDASARQIVLDELHEQEAKFQEQLDFYKEKSLQQDEAWHIYMDAKREDTRIALNIKVINRAASSIQKWWRKLWKKILKRRKKEKKRLAKQNKKKRF